MKDERKNLPSSTHHPLPTPCPRCLRGKQSILTTVDKTEAREKKAMRSTVVPRSRPKAIARRCPLAVGLFTLGLLLVGHSCGAVQASAPDSPASKARQWAALIGVEKYHRVPQLRCSSEDVRQLASTLRVRCGFESDCILEITDQASNPRYQPLRASIQAELPGFLKQAGPEDSMLLYFTGHGFRDKQGKLYLAPLDCDPGNLGATALPVEWLRKELADCKARSKLLVLDACHAGSEKGPGEKNSVAADDLGEPFRSLERVVTLASSTANQKSQIWDEKRQSLFSYWLNQGLRGHADADNNGVIDIDELYRYVSRSVTNTAKAQFPMLQTPVRVVRSGVVDVPVVVRLEPQPLRQVLEDVADQFAQDVLQRKVKKVGVLEFVNDTKLGELLGADFGLLGRYCAEELERRLIEQGGERFSVVDRRQLQRALSEQGFNLEDLGSRAALQSLATKTGGMPVIAVGTLRNRAGRVMNILCKLVRTDSDELAGSAGGTAVLNESEWAMLGRSVQVKPEDRRPEYTKPGQPVRPPEEQVFKRMDEKAEGPHPLLDANFPYRVKIMIASQERKPVFRDNQCFVPVRKGETYEIWVENPTGRIVLLRLLVDGLNTLPEKETTKGVKTTIIGKRVNLAEARHWELDPADIQPALGPVWAIRGFVTETGVAGKLREFVVVDADESLAARRKFTDQVGLITAAFYAPAGGERRVGTGLGKERDEEILKAHALTPGNLLGVVHIRYVEAEALEKGQKE